MLARTYSWFSKYFYLTMPRQFFRFRFIVETWMIVATKKRREDWFDERASSSNIAANEKSWDMLWKVAMPAKIRNFLWRLAHKSIPTEDVRNHRNMSPIGTCYVLWYAGLLETQFS